MRYFIFISLLLVVSGTIFFSCKKWKDPAAVTDPRLTNPYCNDPNAVNYNWGFPGKPDNTLCFYPSDLFTGSFVFLDSIYSESGTTAGLYLGADSVFLTISKVSQSLTKLTVSGFCNANLAITATPDFVATLDTTVGDTLTPHMGQIFCRTQDTVSGTITDNRVDSTLYIVLQVASDTGITQHIGRALRRK